MKGEKMKVYLFYLISDGLLDIREYPGISYDTLKQIGSKTCFLYAFTCNKEERKLFISERDMNLFYEKKIKMTEEEYQTFLGKNLDYILQFRCLQTKICSNNRYRVHGSMVLATVKEYFNIVANEEKLMSKYLDDVITESLSHLKSNCFSKPYEKVLMRLKFDDISYYRYPYEELPFSPIAIDYLALFIRTYKNTFKGSE